MKKTNGKFKSSLFVVGIVALALSSCKKDDDLVKVPPPDQNDVELITTMKITFTDAANVQPTVTATFQDLDGPGGDDPDIFEDIILAPNTTYSAEILLLNETETPADTISNEVLEEDDEHLFCFTPSGANLTISRTDSDGTYEVGLLSEWVTGAASSGSTIIVLRHQPDVKDGSCDPGESDIEINFTTKIQ
ncbi:MAG: type 1 periplasmic binding fold superfamily protein [Crocinitomicaceae bacterium]